MVQSGLLPRSRREFIERTGVSVALSVFGLSFFTSCSDTEEIEPFPTNGIPPTDKTGSTGIEVSGNKISIDLTIQTNLNVSGGWILITEAKTLVSKVGNSFVALTSICTHEGCDSSWSFKNSTYNCACHGSKFDAQGNVLTGPATTPLKAYTSSVSGNVLTITK